MLEALWHDNGLHVWAPTAEKIRAADATPQWGLPHNQLREIVGDVSADALLASIATEDHLQIWLPTADDDVLLQAPPRTDPLATSSTPTTTPAAPHWSLLQIPTLRFAATDALDWLTSIGCNTPPNPNANPCADSIQCFSELATFIQRRITAGQFYPDIQRETDGSYRALWRLLLVGPTDAPALAKFARGLPALTRAAADGPKRRPRDPATLVESFLLTVADAALRRQLSRDPFLEGFADQPNLPRTADVAWLTSLLSPTGIIPATGDLEELLTRIKTWVSPVDQGRASPPVQVRFTLLEPPDTEEEIPEDAQAWRLELGVLPLERERDVITAEALWAKDTQESGILSRDIVEWRSRLVAELTRAAEICPFLARAAAQPEPAAALLTTAEAAEFISHSTKKLRDRGFSVVLPAWAGRAEREVGLVLYVEPKEPDEEDLFNSPSRARSAAGSTGLQEMLRFDWRTAVGDIHLSVDEYRKIAAQQVGLVKLRGQWVEINPTAATKAVAFLEKKEKQTMTLAEAFRVAYVQGHAHAQTGLPILGLGGSGWIGDLLTQGPIQKMEALDQPPNFQGTLRPYQRRGLDWMAFLDSLGIGACLADDMGLGKTIQLIALLLHERNLTAAHNQSLSLSSSLSSSNPPSSPSVSSVHSVVESPPSIENRGGGNSKIANLPTLIFAPTSVVGNWLRELERFAPSLKVLVQHGPQRLRGPAFTTAIAQHDVVITSYALAYRDAADLQQPQWGRVVLDEAQKIKNPSSAAALAIRGIPAPHRVALTGTPVENHLSELWSIMEVLNPGLLGAAAEFRENFAVPIEKLHSQPQAERLRKMVQPFLLRRLKTDPAIMAELPEKIESREYCHLTAEQAALYEAVVAQMLGKIDEAQGIQRRGLVLAALTRLKQICDHPELVADAPGSGPLDNRSGKCERLVEMLEEVLDEGDAALVFTQYRQMGHLLERLLAQRLGLKPTDILFLHGGTPAKTRQAMVDAFQSPDQKSRARIFILSLRAGGLGLNLTAATHVFHFDRWWNPAVEAQATDRAHRIGQTRKVQVHKFVCTGTVEERVDRLLNEKLALAEKVISSGEQWLTNLSTQELRGYLQLSGTAVADV